MNCEIKNDMVFIDGKQVAYKATPNHAGSFIPKYLILHYTAATQASGSLSWMLSKESQVSAHLLIDTDGTVTQLCPLTLICWHAGQSQWKNIIGMNSHSIGIEFVNGGILDKKGSGYVCPVDGEVVRNFTIIDGKAWQSFPQAQIDAGLAVAKAIKEHYKVEDILGHNDIAPLRKIDPGKAFPWKGFKDLLAASAASLTTTTGVNIRTEMKLSPETIIKTLPKGTSVVKQSEQNGWSFVVVDNDVKGWIKSEYLK